ncbi:MAG: 3-hydroxyacyl-CoA dehydrogenase family protein [Nakamurella sp.]
MTDELSLRGGVVVIGGGTMGQGIATAALMSGLSTTVVDVDGAMLQRAEATIARRIRRARDKDAATVLAGLTLSTDMLSAVADAAVVIEAVPEIVELKISIFAQLADAARATALLVSNTSTMSITRLADAAAGSGRVIGMHFFNPAHKMPLVEVVTASSTTPLTVRDALALATALGKDPILVKDVPGFVTSRLGLLLGSEAMRMVEEGVAPAADIDKAMRLGYGHPMGPLELADLVGLDVRLNNLKSMQQRSDATQYRVPRILQRLVDDGNLGKKTKSGFYRYDTDGHPILPGRL